MLLLELEYPNRAAIELRVDVRSEMELISDVAPRWRLVERSVQHLLVSEPVRGRSRCSAHQDRTHPDRAHLGSLWPLAGETIDSAYGSTEMLGWLVHERGTDPHIPVFDKSGRKDGTFERSDFTYDHRRDLYTCPGG